MTGLGSALSDRNMLSAIATRQIATNATAILMMFFLVCAAYLAASASDPEPLNPRSTGPPGTTGVSAAFGGGVATAPAAPAGKEPFSAVKRSTVSPIEIVSPRLSLTSSVIICPLTPVPLSVARSAIHASSPLKYILQWCRESSSSGIEMSFFADLPIPAPGEATSKVQPLPGSDSTMILYFAMFCSCFAAAGSFVACRFKI